MSDDNTQDGATPSPASAGSHGNDPPCLSGHLKTCKVCEPESEARPGYPSLASYCPEALDILIEELSNGETD
jgi:hypothetical protein